jgi:hypothetical protein
MEALQDKPLEGRVYRYSITGWLGTLAQVALLGYMGYSCLTRGPGSFPDPDIAEEARFTLK